MCLKIKRKKKPQGGKGKINIFYMKTCNEWQKNNSEEFDSTAALAH